MNHMKNKEKVFVQEELRKADYFNCCAEIEPVPRGDKVDKMLYYRCVGTKGKVDVNALTPGKWGNVYAEHHPTLGMTNLTMIGYCFYQYLKIGYCCIHLITLFSTQKRTF